MRAGPGRGHHRRMNTTHTTYEFPSNIVTAMYAPVLFTAGGWMLALLGASGGSLGVVLLGMMLLLCAVVLAVPMTGLAVYRAIKVDTRPMIWGAALLDAAVVLVHGALLYVASQ